MMLSAITKTILIIYIITMNPSRKFAKVTYLETVILKYNFLVVIGQVRGLTFSLKQGYWPLLLYFDLPFSNKEIDCVCKTVKRQKRESLQMLPRKLIIDVFVRLK